MNPIPDGYRQNALGHLVPEDAIDPIDLARDELVTGLIEDALRLHENMKTFKHSAMETVESWLTDISEKYGATIGGERGNVRLTSFDGRYQVTIQVQDHLRFDERIKVAKALIDECIHKWVKDGMTEIKALVEHAFQVDKGHIDTGRVLSLTKLEIQDEDWQHAMEALKDSLQVRGTSKYIRFYRRIGDGEYKQIALDLPSL